MRGGFRQGNIRPVVEPKSHNSKAIAMFSKQFVALALFVPLVLAASSSFVPPRRMVSFTPGPL